MDRMEALIAAKQRMDAIEAKKKADAIAYFTNAYNNILIDLSEQISEDYYIYNFLKGADANFLYDYMYDTGIMVSGSCIKSLEISVTAPKEWQAIRVVDTTGHTPLDLSSLPDMKTSSIELYTKYLLGFQSKYNYFHKHLLQAEKDFCDKYKEQPL